MIPEELHLRNFMSHRETDLDLRGVHLASLVGDNGAGKSSLLDAITWVVWGRSRASHNRDEDLVYHGETSMEVEYVFRMPYQSGIERRCRILRRREERGQKTVQTTLDLQMQDEQGWQSLTSGSVRETQSRILDTLGLDYNTFVNSAYLRQGNADEFTVQTPTDRKKVLAMILGLDRWPVYQDRARQALSTTQGRLREIDRRLDEINEDLAHQAEYEAMLAQAQADADTADVSLHTLQDQMDELSRKEEQRASIQRTLGSVAQQIAQETQRLQQLEHERDTHKNLLAAFQALLAQVDDIETQYHRYQHALESEKQWNEKLGTVAQLQAQQADLERELSRARSDLERQIRDLERAHRVADQEITAAGDALERQMSTARAELDTLRERFVSEEVLNELQSVEAELHAFDEQTEKLNALRRDAQVNREYVTGIKARNQTLRQYMDEEKERLDKLEQAEAQCPLCGQPLNDVHRDELLIEIKGRGTQMADEYRANQDAMLDMDVSYQAIEQDMREMERALQLRSKSEHQAARLRQRIEQDGAARERAAALKVRCESLQQQLTDHAFAEEARFRKLDLQKSLEHLQAQLDAEAYAPELRVNLAEIIAKRADVGYDAAQHNHVKAQLKDLAGAERAWQDLEKARVSAQNEQVSLERVKRDLVVQEDRCAQLDAQKLELDTALQSLAVSLQDAGSIRQAYQQARMQSAKARQQLGAAEQNLAALETQAARQEGLQTERREVAQLVAVYTELRDAFGVNGIPAMIIEHTLPELERESNRVLQQLTGGRMHVRFETQRETKSGNLSETLDIIISDEKGTRPYETFSGGEQFRANFAIRVALSRLLAQRSGVRLRSLFVDEGFGALDADGRQRLTEAVKAVQSDFDMVLVITHVEELREAFPTQIRVLKTDSGSMVEVI